MRIVVLLLTITFSCYAQVDEFRLGASAGYGAFQSNSPQISGIYINATASFTVRQIPWFFIQSDLVYFKDRDSFLPSNSKGKYYPSVLLAGISAQINQSLTESFFLRASAGPALLVDKTFSDRNAANTALYFTAALGYQIAKYINLAGNYNTAVSFSENSASYNSISLGIEYRFF